MEFKPSEILHYNKDYSEEQKKSPMYQNFLDWCFSHGLKWTGVDFPAFFGPSGQLRGMVCSRDIQPYEAVLAVPNELLISSEEIRDDPALFKIFSQYEMFYDQDDGSYNTVLIGLLYHKALGKKSRFYEYFQMIEEFQNGTNMSQETFEFIQDPTLRDFVEEIQDNFKKDYAKIRPIILKNSNLFPGIGYKEYIWAEQFVASRTFSDYWPGRLAVPMVDLCNHSHARLATAEIINLKLERASKEEREKAGYWKLRGNFDLKLILDESKFDASKVVETKDKSSLENTSILEYLEGYVDSSDSEEEDEEEKQKEEETLSEEQGLEGKEENPDDYTHYNEFQMDFPWYDHQDKDNYFVIANNTNKVLPKGSELTIYYGPKSNKYLMTWYGFAYIDNPDDFYTLEFIKDPELRNKLDLPQGILQKYIKSKELSADSLVIGEIKIKPSVQLKSCQVKRFKICFPLLEACREYQKETGASSESTSSLMAQLDLERQSLEAYKASFEHLLSSYQRSAEEDKRLIDSFDSSDLPYHLLVIVICEYTWKIIFRHHAALAQILLSILKEVSGLLLVETEGQSGPPKDLLSEEDFKKLEEILLKPHPPETSLEHLKKNRQYMGAYLKYLLGLLKSSN